MKACEQHRAVSTSMCRFGGALWMRHQAEYPTVRAQNARDVRRRSIGIVNIGERDPVFSLKAFDQVRIRKEVSVVMRDGKHNLQVFPVFGGECAVRGGDVKALRPANIPLSGVSKQGSGKNARFRQNLEAVADTEGEAASVCMGDQGPADRRPGRDSAAAEIVTVAETAGNTDDVCSRGQIGLPVPDQFHAGAGIPEGYGQIPVTV